MSAAFGLCREHNGRCLCEDRRDLEPCLRYEVAADRGLTADDLAVVDAICAARLTNCLRTLAELRERANHT